VKSKEIVDDAASDDSNKDDGGGAAGDKRKRPTGKSRGTSAAAAGAEKVHRKRQTKNKVCVKESFVPQSGALRFADGIMSCVSEVHVSWVSS